MNPGICKLCAGFMILLSPFILSAAEEDQQTTPGGKPNIVVILADDIGPGDIAFYHRKRTGKPPVVPTPNLDRLIDEGMRFSDAHSAAPLCAPSRFGMLTGSYSYRGYRPYGVWSPCAKSGIYPKYITMADIAKQAGYATAFFGKWGTGGGFNDKNGKPAEPWAPKEDVDYTVRTSGPNQHGFDYSFELPCGIQNAPFAFYENDKWIKLGPDSTFKVIGPEQSMYNISRKHNDLAEPGDSNWDPTLAGPMIVEKATEYIRKQVAGNPDQPFLIYYCTQAVHIPHTPPKELNGVRIAGATPGVHADMILELDVQIGMLIDSLKEAGVYDNTLFIFTSDNGGLAADPAAEALGHDPTDGWRGIKGAITEGGHRVPFIAVWPGVIAPGTESDEPISALDVVATIAAITDQDISRDVVMDSIDLMPLLTQKPDARGHEYLMHYASWGGTALRQGNWKLQMWGKNMHDQKPTKLYNLKDNPGEDEEQDLLNHPEQQARVEAMFNMYKRFLQNPTVTGSASSFQEKKKPEVRTVEQAGKKTAEKLERKTDWKLSFPETKEHFVTVQLTWARKEQYWNPTRADLEAKFDELDTDGDGLLSEEEWNNRPKKQ